VSDVVVCKVQTNKEDAVVNKELALSLISETLVASDCVLSAKMYGSWLCDEMSVDCDIAVIIPSVSGVVDSNVYRLLLSLRDRLVEATGNDIDLVPHTIDELDDLRSPLWYPRYNPSLVSGVLVKGEFSVLPITKNERMFSFADLTAYVIHDNRTICRRQLVRSLQGESGRIFVSKLLHGAGNALTFYACQNKTEYLSSPSDIDGCFEALDRTYGVDSKPARAFLRGCKRSFDFEKGLLLMSWYESLAALVFNQESAHLYQATCDHLPTS
jgi:predicted nucleotidyltransferase